MIACEGAGINSIGWGTEWEPRFLSALEGQSVGGVLVICLMSVFHTVSALVYFARLFLGLWLLDTGVCLACTKAW